MIPDKTKVLLALRESLGAELAAVESIAATTRDEVGSDETRQEGKYDTRSTEASYLARGQAWRIDALRRLVSWFKLVRPQPMEHVQVGALVALDGPRRDLVFVAPVGGASADVDGHRVRVISPSAPLYQAMAELEAGDGFDVQTPRGTVSWEIVYVA
ncbi:MAG: GreA/GreB family elongation factor [Oligoflexia bacterium]|nr:GreA/GreB family elongation factor [Oligoflexia bacterium]